MIAAQLYLKPVQHVESALVYSELPVLVMHSCQSCVVHHRHRYYVIDIRKHPPLSVIQRAARLLRAYV
jgi:hypothetical protein